MNVTGIIAEYNPFHNGHLYQIKKAKEETNADYIIVIMSGDFVQRGTPAIINKYVRTQMALNCGADMVIEMPSIWATASAEYFATAGVAALDKLGIVTHMSFGAETTNLDLLFSISKVLVEEPTFYKASLNVYLKNGLPFPLAREYALGEYFDTSSEIVKALRTPNNILAIEYLKAIYRRSSQIKPHIVLRKGAGYHDEDSTQELLSATGVRKCLQLIDETTIDSDLNADFLNNLATLQASIPATTLPLLQDYTMAADLLNINHFSYLLKYKLLTECEHGFHDYADCNIDLSNRIVNQLSAFVSYSQFCDLLKSKEITHSHISRSLLHILLNIKFTDYEQGKAMDYIPYLRVLGFRKDAIPLLTRIKKNAVIPLITKMANASELLSDTAYHMLKQDIFAADLYQSAVTENTNQTFPNEFTRGLIIIPNSVHKTQKR